MLGLVPAPRRWPEGFHDVPFERPAARLRDVVTTVRALLDGRPAQLGTRPGGATAARWASRPSPSCRSGSPPSASTRSNVAAELGDGWIPALVARDSTVAGLGDRSFASGEKPPHQHARALTVAAGPHHRRRRQCRRRPGTSPPACAAWYLSAMGDVYARSVAGQGYATAGQRDHRRRTRAPSPRRGTDTPEARVVLDQLAACGTSDQVHEQLRALGPRRRHRHDHCSR